MSRYSFKIFLSHSTEKLRRGTFLLFLKKILVAKNFIDKRWGMKQGGVSRYSIIFFCPRAPKDFVGNISVLL